MLPEKDKQLSAKLARYMDLKAFDAKRVGKEQAEKLKARREIANKRAKAAIRFFMIPENIERLNRQFAERDCKSGYDAQRHADFHAGAA